MPTTSTTGVSHCAIGLSISFWVVVLVRSIDLGAENRPGLCSQGSHSVTHRWVPKYLQDSTVDVHPFENGFTGSIDRPSCPIHPTLSITGFSK